MSGLKTAFRLGDAYSFTQMFAITGYPTADFWFYPPPPGPFPCGRREHTRPSSSPRVEAVWGAYAGFMDITDSRGV